MLATSKTHQEQFNNFGTILMLSAWSFVMVIASSTNHTRRPQEPGKNYILFNVNVKDFVVLQLFGVAELSSGE